jgi:hypothetical protein
MRQPAVVQICTTKSVALARRREAEMETVSARLRLTLQFVTMLIVGWITVSQLF